MPIKEKIKKFWEEHKYDVFLGTYIGAVAGLSIYGCHEVGKAIQKGVEEQQAQMEKAKDEYCTILAYAVVGAKALEEGRYSEEDAIKIIDDYNKNL